MNFGALCATLFDFIVIGLLPLMFFSRSDGYNLKWWLTAIPFFVTPLILIAGYIHIIDAWVDLHWTLQSIQTIVVVIICGISIGLIGMTIGTHRIPLALWHQENDAPQNIVQHGAYQKIRHPFYTSFLLAFAAAFLLMPSLWTGVIFVYSLVLLNVTAAGEEKRLSNSEFGDEYREYMKHTGRFLPPLGKK